MHCFTEKDIVDIIFTYPHLDFLAKAIHNTDLVSQLRKNEQDITFFAPVNAGFNNVPGMMDLFINNQTEMLQILSRHKIIGHGALTTERIMDKMDGHTGLNMTINNHGGGFITFYKSIDGASFTVLEEKGFNKNRAIIAGDIHASNGVIHIIDGVL